MKSEVIRINGLPALSVDGCPIPEIAYITYCTDNNRYEDFASVGTKLYSVNLNFSEAAISARVPVLVFQKGIFENETPDFSIVDKNFGQILEVCPDAYIFPRVNVNLSEKWEKEHPDELCDTSHTGQRRVSFASDLWAQEVKKNLKALIEYIEQSPYADRVIGYQIAGGDTEEWFPLDGYGSFGKRAKEKFLLHCAENKIEANEEAYYDFATDMVADRVCEFANFAKELLNRQKVIGAFYGYTMGGVNRSSCHHAMGKILRCEDIDFLCSPISYLENRAPGTDLYPMVMTDSVKLHGKLYFSENDIRTHLTHPVSDHPNYTRPVWYGPAKRESTEQIKLGFCRAFIHGYGMWWFDMWGGWYDDPDYMDIISKMVELCSEGTDKPVSQIALIIDEKSYIRLDCNQDIVRKVCNAIGLCSAPYDAYLASDFEKICSKYKAFIFVEPSETELLTRCIRQAELEGKAFKIYTGKDTEITAEQLRCFFKEAGILFATDKNAVVHNGEKYFSVYTAERGLYDFGTQDKKTFTDLFTGEKFTFPAELEERKCYLFRR